MNFKNHSKQLPNQTEYPQKNHFRILKLKNY